MGQIWITGMMGTGKTTVGALVAEQLQRPLIDTDTQIMERTGRTIPELFEESETLFRSLERQVIAEVSVHDDSVISTGGGAVLDQRNVERMEATGQIVLLRAHPSEIAQRLAGDESRPLLESEADLSRISAEREDRYLEVCDHVVDTDGRAPSDVAQEVVACVAT